MIPDYVNPITYCVCIISAMIRGLAVGLQSVGIVAGIVLLIALADLLISIIMAPLFVLKTKLALLEFIYKILDIPLMSTWKRRKITPAYMILKILKYQCQEYLEKGLSVRLASIYPFPGPSPFEEVISRIKMALKMNVEDDKVKSKFAKILNSIYIEKELHELFRADRSETVPFYIYELESLEQFQLIPFHLPILCKLDNVKIIEFVSILMREHVVNEKDIIGLRDSFEADWATTQYMNELVYYIYGYTIGDCLTPYIYKKAILSQISVFEKFVKEYDDEIESFFKTCSVSSLVNISNQLHQLQLENRHGMTAPINLLLRQYQQLCASNGITHTSIHQLDIMRRTLFIADNIGQETVAEAVIEKLKYHQQLWFLAVKPEQLINELKQLIEQLPETNDENLSLNHTIPFMVLNPWENMVHGLCDIAREVKI